MKSFPALSILVNVVALALLLPALYLLLWSFNTFGGIVLPEFKTLLMGFQEWLPAAAQSADVAIKAFVKNNPFLSLFAISAFYLAGFFAVSPKARIAFPGWYEKRKGTIGLALLGMFFWLIASEVKPNSEANLGPVEAWFVSKVLYLVAVGFFYSALPVETKHQIKEGLQHTLMVIRDACKCGQLKKSAKG